MQEMIRAGELRDGELLPAQRELAERLNVSRSSLRKALSVLKTLGVVRTEPRRGTRIAAVRVSAAELGALAQNLKDFKTAVREGDLVASSQLDFGFHRLIMECSGNRVFADLYGSYGSVLLESQHLPRPGASGCGSR